MPLKLGEPSPQLTTGRCVATDFEARCATLSYIPSTRILVWAVAARFRVSDSHSS